MTKWPPKPVLVAKNGKPYTPQGELVEWYEDRYRIVVDSSRSGWWRFNEHYDSNGY